MSDSFTEKFDMLEDIDKLDVNEETKEALLETFLNKESMKRFPNIEELMQSLNGDEND